MIEAVEGKSGKKIYAYQPPSMREKEKRFHRLIDLFQKYARARGISPEKIEFDYTLINEINVRVDRRKDYYIVFHKETYLSEVREAALLAFWILKFKPFLIVSDVGKDYVLNVNCGFATYILFGAVSEYVKRESQRKGENKKFKVTSEYLNNLQYAFKYWDLSKEAMMLIAETLCGCVEQIEES